MRSTGGTHPGAARPNRLSRRSCMVTRSRVGSQGMDLRITTPGAKGKGPRLSRSFGLQWGVRRRGEFQSMASIQATKLRKGTLIRMGDALLRVIDLYHITPGNKR